MGTALVNPARLAYVPPHWDAHGVNAVELYGVCTFENRQRAKVIMYSSYGKGIVKQERDRLC